MKIDPNAPMWRRLLEHLKIAGAVCLQVLVAVKTLAWLIGEVIRLLRGWQT